MIVFTYLCKSLELESTDSTLVNPANCDDFFERTKRHIHIIYIYICMYINCMI